MSSFAAIRRYYLLFEKVSKSHFPSFSDINSYFQENDCEISSRTLQRDISHLRYDFGIEIAYNKNKNGYFIDNEVSIKPDVFLRFLEVVATADMLTESIKDSKDTLRYIQFESEGNMKGIEQLPKILHAIKEFKSIQFDHFNFMTGSITNYSIQPYLLKEYQSRWYVIGKPENLDEFRTFGIDRISDLKINKDSFTRTDEKPEEFFSNVIGLNWNPFKIETIQFEIFKPHDNYIKTLPLHSSQIIVSENDNFTLFEIQVVINYELIQRFLMLGSACMVKSPNSFVNQIIEIIEIMQINYSKE